MTKEDLQLIAFEIIGHAGEALSNYYTALDKARQGDFAQCNLLLEDATKAMQEAHHQQTTLLSQEAEGGDFELSLIMVHAQDHLMNAVLAERLVKEMIALHKELQSKA